MDNYFDDSRGKKIKLLRIGTVVNNQDPNGVGALKVRLDGGIDKNDNDTDLIDCLPLLPRFLNIMPEVGEGVFIFSSEYIDGLEINQKSERFWFGPIFSQLQNLEKEDKDSGIRGFLRGIIKPNKPIDEIPEANGAYPKKNEIAIQGRGTGDIILKNNETLLRIGKFKEDNRLKFNNVNLGYIQLKEGGDDLKKEFVDESVTTYKYTPPDFVVRVVIRSILSDGTVLGENLTDDEYDGASTHEVLITKIDLKTNTIINSGSGTFNNRGGAISDLDSTLKGGNEFGGDFGLSGKWQLYTKVKEILEKYAEGSQESFKNYTITYPGSTEETQETKKVLKLSKNTTGKKSSIVNVVADRINLISHDGNHTFELTDPEKLITNDTQNKIQSSPKNGGAQSIVFGEKLVEFLELIRDYVKLHVHPYHGMPADPEITKLNVIEFDLQSILNKNIKTN